MTRNALEHARDELKRAHDTDGDSAAFLRAFAQAALAIAEELREMNDRADTETWINGVAASAAAKHPGP